MYCYLSSCDNSITKFEDNGDCIVSHAIAVKRELDRILAHYGAMKEKMEENIQACNKFETKYKEQKFKNQRLLEKMGKKRSPATEKSETSRKSRHDKTLEGVSANSFDPDSDNQEKLFKTTTKFQAELVGKENSSKKKRLTSEVSQALTFSRVRDQFRANNHPQASTARSLKQQKISFAPLAALRVAIGASGASDSSKSLRAHPKKDDLNICQVFEKPEKKKGNTSRNSLKTVDQEPARKPSSVVKRKKSVESSVRRAVTDSSLFAFQQPTKRQFLDSVLFKPANDPDETPDISQMIIKQEKLSESNIASDLDIFADAESSSVAWIDNDELHQVISIQDHTENFVDQDHVLQERQPKFNLSRESPEIPFVPPRKRVRIYGECKDCREFYEKYAAINGATQADEHIHQCPKKCKGYIYRVRRAEPPPNHPNHTPRRIDPENPTPEGFWDIPFTAPADKNSKFDPDQTLDGLDL